MKTKVLFLIPAFTAGGAEQNLLRLLKEVGKSTRFTFSVALFKRDSKFCGELSESVNVYHLISFGRWNFPLHVIRLLFLLRESRPEIVISYFLYCNACVVIAKILSMVSLVSVFSIRVSPWHGQKHEKFGWLRMCVLKWLYTKADRLLVNANDMKNELIHRFELTNEIISIIPNSIDFEHIQLQSEHNITHSFFGAKPIIISAGRLVHQKGFDTLFKAVALLKDSIAFKLIILGDGPKKVALQKLAVVLGINELVSMVGFQKNPYAWMSKSDVFVLPSRWEGLPNALMDAMACGLAVVACDCPTGPRDLIKNGENGYLTPVENVENLATVIKKLLEDASLRERLGQCARESVQKYSVENIGRQFESLLLRLTSH